jgi:PPOX class probable F420-dependent enzyme
MPGYGVAAQDHGSGLLPWSWAEERLGAARNYWVSTVRPDGRPHAMPVWGLWDGEVLWFTSGGGSRKIRNLRANQNCVITTEDAMDPVVVEGVAEIVADREVIAALVPRLNAKYGESYTAEFLDPDVNATVRVVPRQVIGMRHEDFTGSPTRWRPRATS